MIRFGRLRSRIGETGYGIVYWLAFSVGLSLLPLWIALLIHAWGGPAVYVDFMYRGAFASFSVVLVSKSLAEYFTYKGKCDSRWRTLYCVVLGPATIAVGTAAYVLAACSIVNPETLLQTLVALAVNAVLYGLTLSLAVDHMRQRS